MDQHDQRMECLRMAFELGGKAEPVVSAAQQLLDFLAGTSSTVESRAEQAQVGAAGGAPEQQEAAAESGSPADDAIAACGTVLVMPEGGGLEDAIQSVEPAPDAAEERSAALDARPSTTTEDSTPDAVALINGADAGVSESQDSRDAPATQELPTPDAAFPTHPDTAAVEHLPAPEGEPDQVMAKADGQPA